MFFPIRKCFLFGRSFFFAEIRSAEKKSNCAVRQKIKQFPSTLKMDTWRPNRAIRTNRVSQTFAEIETRTFSHFKKTVFYCLHRRRLNDGGVNWSEGGGDGQTTGIYWQKEKKRKKKINRKQNENSISCHLTVWWICECFSFFLVFFELFFQIENFFAFATVSRPGNGC